MDVDISFSKDVFTREEFNVDRFLQESCQKSGLHRLHKELGVYIKYLQSMIVDLVNNESNAIVNLSSELKLLQNNFSSLETPLGQLREELMQIHKMMENNLNSIKYLLARKEETVVRRNRKMNELRALAAWQKVCSIVGQEQDEENKEPLDLEVLERGLNQCVLQHMYWQLSGQESPPQQHPRLKHALQQALLNSLDTRDTHQVARCLQMYTLLGETGVCEAEQLYREKVIRPVLVDMITERRLQETHNGDLFELYNEVLKWLRDNTSHLQSAILQRVELSVYRPLLNAILPEIVHQIKHQLSTIYAPGVPGVFQQRYLATQHFLKELCELWLHEVERREFKKSECYRHQRQLWNLTVYMHIRNREIVDAVEAALLAAPSQQTPSAEQAPFRVAAFAIAWSNIQRCFAEDVFLPELLDKFFKLMVQIISRLTIWIDTLLADKQIEDELRLNFFSNVHADVEILIHRLSGPLDFLQTRVPSVLQEKVRLCLDEATVRALPARITAIERTLADIIYKQCSSHVKDVSQIPRLYRKTNRAAPTTPSPYVNAMCSPAVKYEQMTLVSGPAIARVLSTVHSRIAAEYTGLVDSLLTSVARTEESLRRLKRTRGADSSVASGEPGDDHKIRTQVQLDVTSYCKHAAPHTDTKTLLALINTNTNT